MTNEEAIHELEWVKERGFVADKGIIGTDRIVEAVSMAIEALEKSVKYKWHYDDLPEKPLCGSKGYLVKESDVKEPFTMWWDGEEFTDVDDEPPTATIVAWREIEPFPGEKYDE